MLRYSKLTITACTAFLLFACSTAPSKQDQGVIIGAIAGGIIGNQVGGGSSQVLQQQPGPFTMKYTPVPPYSMISH